MSRTLSSTMLQTLYKQNTGEVVLILITIDHDDLVSPIRVTSDAIDTVSNSNTFVAFPFEIVLPDEPEGTKSPRATIRVSNVDRTIADTLRSISSAPTMTLQVVLGSDPDTVEVEWPGFKLRNVQITDLSIQGELDLDDFILEPYPADIYTPSTFPGLF